MFLQSTGRLEVDSFVMKLASCSNHWLNDVRDLFRWTMSKGTKFEHLVALISFVAL